MAWQTPKTDWSAADGVRDSDFNRIEGNILELYNKASLLSNVTIYVDASTGTDSAGSGTSGTPYKTIGYALNSIQKNLGGKTVTVHIAQGTYNEDIAIVGYNDGVIVLGGDYGANVSIDYISVDCSVVEIRDINLSVVSGGIFATRGSTLLAYTPITISGSSRGLHIIGGSRFRSDSTVTVNDSTASAIQVAGASMAYIYNIAGSNNENAIIAEEGSVVGYGTTDISVNVAGYITRTGGRIYTGGE